MARKAWYPTSGPKQVAMYTNIKGKIQEVGPVLGLTQAQVDRILLICNIFISVYSYIEAMRATTSGLVEWRDDIFTGGPTGSAAPPPPEYAAFVAIVGMFKGIVTEFKDLRELIVALPAYTPAIGEDLMIVGEEETSAPEGNVAPDIKVSTEPGYIVRITGSMQGLKAIRIEYQRIGSTVWTLVAFSDKLPHEFTIQPATPGQPESGRIRGIFIRDGVSYGNWTNDIPVTIS